MRLQPVGPEVRNVTVTGAVALAVMIAVAGIACLMTDPEFGQQGMERAHSRWGSRWDWNSYDLQLYLYHAMGLGKLAPFGGRVWCWKDRKPNPGCKKRPGFGLYPMNGLRRSGALFGRFPRFALGPLLLCGAGMFGSCRADALGEQQIHKPFCRGLRFVVG